MADSAREAKSDTSSREAQTLNEMLDENLLEERSRYLARVAEQRAPLKTRLPAFEPKHLPNQKN